MFEMKLQHSELNLIEDARNAVDRWRWCRWMLVILVLFLFVIAYVLIFIIHEAGAAGILGAYTGLQLSYLLRNWSFPKKEVLILKLYEQRKT